MAPVVSSPSSFFCFIPVVGFNVVSGVRVEAANAMAFFHLHIPKVSLRVH